MLPTETFFIEKMHSFTKGFSEWKTAECSCEHERSLEYRNYKLIWIQSTMAAGTTDPDVAQQFQSQFHYRREVLKHVSTTIKLLSGCRLVFCGHDEVLWSLDNGNYLGYLELIDQFDSFGANHIAKFGQKGKCKPSYLSSIYDEFIDLLGCKVKNTIID